MNNSGDDCASPSVKEDEAESPSHSCDKSAIEKEEEQQQQVSEEVGTTVASAEEEWSSESGACAAAETGNEVALGCNAETLGYSHTVQFAELPHLVIEEVLRHLDTPAKLALRLTCRATKQWVETPKLMQLFELCVKSNQEMVSLVEYSRIFPVTRWKRVIFPERLFASYASFPSFVSTFSCHITHVRIQYFDGGLAQILFISSCDALEYLRLDEMDLRQNPALVVASDKMLKAKCPKLLDVFTELRGFHIGTILFNDVKQLAFYQTFLQRCKKLKEINIPRPQGPTTISWDAVKNIQLKSIFGPIKEYLQKKPMTSPIKTDIEIMDVDGLFSRHFPAVAETCVQIGSPTLFDHVNEKHVKYLFTHEGAVLQRVTSLREKINDRRPVSQWDKLARLYVRSSRSDVRNEYPGYTAFPSLKSLTLIMDSRSRDDPNFSMLERLVHLLIHAERVKLQEFLLQWPLFSHDTPQDYIRANDFVGNFGNLRVLHVTGWTAPDDDFLLILNVLGKLTVLILDECLNLTDWGLLGSAELEQPAIMNLRDLTRLEIRNRNTTGYLTNECFERAFMHMRLKHLLVDSFHVTIKGYEYLKEGEFRSTIQKLPCPHVLPHGFSSEDDFAAFVASNFSNVLI